MAKQTTRFNAPSPTPAADHNTAAANDSVRGFLSQPTKSVGDEISDAMMRAINDAERKHRKVA